MLGNTPAMPPDDGPAAALRRQFSACALCGPAAVIETGCPEVDRALSGGIRQGAMHEMGGPGATGFVVALARRFSGQVLWIAPAGQGAPFYPPGLAAAGLDPGRLVRITAYCRRDLLWAAEESLKSGAGGLAIIELDRPITLSESRRLSLSAQAGRTTGFVLAHAAMEDDAGTPKPLAPGVWTRWAVSGLPAAHAGYPRWRIELVRNRAGITGKWSIDWHEQENRFRVVRQSGHRPARPADAHRLAG